MRGKVQREGEREWERLRARERGERCATRKQGKFLDPTIKKIKKTIS